MTQIPTLQTDRLVLRVPKPSDYPAYHALMAAPAAEMMGAPYDAETSWMAFGAEVGTWAPLGFGSWTLCRSGSDAFIGMVGIDKPPHFPETDLGWMLAPAARGQGYATEAAHQARRFAYETLGLATLVSYVDPRNAASIAVAERLNATRDADAARPDPEDIVFRHPPPEALQ